MIRDRYLSVAFARRRRVLRLSGAIFILGLVWNACEPVWRHRPTRKRAHPSCVHRRDERLDADDIHHAGEIIGEHV
jgi:hypothetical protein